MNFNIIKNTFMPLLRSYDPFAVLPPEKVLRESVDKPNPDTEPIGSFLTASKEATVVDVFDNLFVTPQQVSSNNIGYGDEELTKFLDKYDDENVGKLIDISDENESKADVPTLSQEKNIKVLEPNIVVDDDLDEDLIDELLFNMCMEKRRLKEMSDRTAVDKVATASPTVVRHDKNKNNYVKEDIRTNSDVKNVNIMYTTSNTEHSTRMLNIEEKLHKMWTKKNTPKPTFTHQNSQNSKVLMETMQKDVKLFKKRRIIKPDKEISKYTKGAGFYEKSVVLPQIMVRLTNRKIAHDIKKSMPKKLLLDTGASIAPVEDTVVSIAPNETDNEFTNAREVRRKKMEEYVSDQKIGDLKVKLGDSATNPCPAENNGKTNLTTKTSEANNTKNKHQITISKDVKRQILMAIISQNDLDAASSSKILNGDSQKKILSPEVLMEDCNKQRLMEFQKRRMFDNFVRGGDI